MISLLAIGFWVWTALAFAPPEYGDECEKAVIVRYQPVVYDCQGTTTETVLRSTYTDCAPTSCVPRVQNLLELFEAWGGNYTRTITTIGPEPGTSTLPFSRDGEATVIVTETSGRPTTITTTGMTPGTTTFPGSSGDPATIYVTVVPDEAATTTVTDEELVTTTLPIDTTDGVSSGDRSMVVTILTSTSEEDSGRPTTLEPTEDGATTEPTTAMTEVLTSLEPTQEGTTTEPTRTMTEMPTNTPDQICPDVENGDFFVNGGGVLPPWYLSDQVTANSGVVQAPPGGTVSEAAFALIPSQTQFAQVYLNQQLPSCGDPPPVVTLNVRFNYQFTGDSSGCMIGASVNRSPDNILSIQEDTSSLGVWQEYIGDPVQVQLTYDPLFTLKLSCAANTANQPAILITDISVY